ncbi:MAG: very short patch repair endonuclease [Labedaea sp.]
MSRAASAAEQDKAAGGAERRQIFLSDGRVATASICLRVLPKSRRIYAYLRWSDAGKTTERYICQVHGATRRENLASAWREILDTTGSDITAIKPAHSLPKSSWATSEAVRAVMRGNKGRDTRPELALRSAVHARGMRFRVNARPLPAVRRTADLVFPRLRVAVFLDGCFWHGCPDHHRPATTNNAFWASKIDATHRRDADTNQRLEDAGWTVIRVWEHEDPDQAAGRIQEVVRTGSIGS